MPRKLTEPGPAVALHYQVLVWALSGPARTVAECAHEFQLCESRARVYLGTLDYCKLGTMRLEQQPRGHRRLVFRPTRTITDREPDKAAT